MKAINSPKPMLPKVSMKNQLPKNMFNYLFLSLLIMLWLIPQAHAEGSYQFELAWPEHDPSCRTEEPNPLIARDSKGLLYERTYDDFLIRVSSSNGQYLRYWTEGLQDSRGDISISGNDLVYVVDITNSKIKVFDTTGKFIGAKGSYGSENGQFMNPTGITVGANGLIYVADTGNHRIQAFDSTGRFIGSLGSSGSGNGQFDYPQGVAVSDSGLIYVADTGNHRIQVFSATGKFIGSTGKLISSTDNPEDWRSSFPGKIALSASGKVYVMDGEKLSIFDTNGKLICNTHLSGSRDSQFRRPEKIAISASNLVYIADTGNDRIQVFDATGKFIHSWGQHGSGEGGFNEPYAINISTSGLVYVIDRGGE